MNYLLSILIWLPIIGGIIVFPLHDNIKFGIIKNFFIGIMLCSMYICFIITSKFDCHIYSIQYIEHYLWIPIFNVHYYLGVDGLSLLLIDISVLVNIIIVLSTYNDINFKKNQYISLILIIQGLLVGVFSAKDAILFYIFWESMLIPMYLIIGIWGSHNRSYAAIKFFIYTLFGSLFMLLTFIYLGSITHSFNIENFYTIKLNTIAQTFIFFSLLLSFAIKIPMFPLHTWLPYAHTEAPTGGSILLAAILLKLGAYGFIRFLLPIVPNLCNEYSIFIIVLSIIAIIYIGFIALIQKDIKRIIAYSSISHMGMFTLGCFSTFLVNKFQSINANLLLEGAIIVIISHSLTSSAMFSSIGFIYKRTHTRMIKNLSGIVNNMPIFSTFLMLFSMANIGFPGTLGFVGEFMIIIGSISTRFWIAFCAACMMIIGSSYTLWMYKRIIFGSINKNYNHNINFTDLDKYEVISFTVLSILIIFLGIFPKLLLNYIHQFSNYILLKSSISQLKIK